MVFGEHPGAIFVESLAQVPIEALALDALASRSDVVAALEHTTGKSWMTSVVARHLAEALLEICGVVVQLGDNGSVLAIDMEASEGIADRVMCLGVYWRLRRGWYRRSASAREAARSARTR